MKRFLANSALTFSFISFISLHVLQVRSDLTDHYYEELQEMKTRHALELEQLRAKLSDRHLQGTFCIHVKHLLFGIQKW